MKSTHIALTRYPAQIVHIVPPFPGKSGIYGVPLDTVLVPEHSRLQRLLDLTENDSIAIYATPREGGGVHLSITPLTFKPDDAEEIKEVLGEIGTYMLRLAGPVADTTSESVEPEPAEEDPIEEEPVPDTPDLYPDVVVEIGEGDELDEDKHNAPYDIPKRPKYKNSVQLSVAGSSPLIRWVADGRFGRWLACQAGPLTRSIIDRIGSFFIDVDLDTGRYSVDNGEYINDAPGLVEDIEKLADGIRKIDRTRATATTLADAAGVLANLYEPVNATFTASPERLKAAWGKSVRMEEHPKVIGRLGEEKQDHVDYEKFKTAIEETDGFADLTALVYVMTKPDNIPASVRDRAIFSAVQKMERIYISDKRQLKDYIEKLKGFSDPEAEQEDPDYSELDALLDKSTDAVEIMDLVSILLEQNSKGASCESRDQLIFKAVAKLAAVYETETHKLRKVIEAQADANMASTPTLNDSVLDVATKDWGLELKGLDDVPNLLDFIHQICVSGYGGRRAIQPIDISAANQAVYDAACRIDQTYKKKTNTIHNLNAALLDRNNDLMQENHDLRDTINDLEVRGDVAALQRDIEVLQRECAAAKALIIAMQELAQYENLYRNDSNEYIPDYEKQLQHRQRRVEAKKKGWDRLCR